MHNINTITLLIFVSESDMHFTPNIYIMISLLPFQLTLFILKVAVCILLDIFLASILHLLMHIYIGKEKTFYQL